MLRRFVFFIFILVLVGGALWYYLVKQKSHTNEAAAPQMPPPQVTVLEAVPTDVPLTYEYAGRTAGSKEVEIRARVGGILQKRAYTEGQPVKAGDVLFKIDPAPYEAALAETQARSTNAENTWKRIGELTALQAISTGERDEAQAGYAQTKAQLQTARINLGYTTVKSPITGITSREGTSEGSLVMADQTLLTRVTQLDPIYVNFAYPDTDPLNQRAPDTADRLKAEIHFGDGTVYQTPGTINFQDSIIDPMTGTISARAMLSNPDYKILPGQFVRVVITGMVHKNVITVPDQAVMQGPQGTFVYTVTPDSKAKITPVQLGDVVNKDRMITGGLNPGDRVITEGMVKVRPDTPVMIAAPAAAPAESKDIPADASAAPAEHDGETMPDAAPAADKKDAP